MDFFEHQEKARRKTKLLVIYFILAVVFITIAIYLAFAVVLLKERVGSTGWIWDPQLFVCVMLGTLCVIIFGSLYKISELGGGGSVVATSLGGTLLNPHTTNLDEQKLLHVVEEMAIASGIPVPEIYILQDEKAINAFAAGTTPAHAVIGATRGCIRLLTRDELQGVIGHEFSHIFNGDMRLNLRLMGIIFGILCLAIIGRVLMRTRGRKNPLPFLGLILLLIGYIGVFFGRLIKSAVSRQREFLADASSVQFTRNPEGLVGALKKIGGLSLGSQLETSSAEEASHLFFGNGLAESWFGLMSTHPPLEERIRAIDPNFDGKFSLAEGSSIDSVEEESTFASKKSWESGRTSNLAGVTAAMPGFTGSTIKAGMVLPHLGAPKVKHLEYAGRLKSSLPENLVAATREPMSATALIYVLLLSEDEAARNIQLQQLNQEVVPGVYKETISLFPSVKDLAAESKLPLIDLTIPALRHLSPAQYDQFAKTIQLIIESDRQIDLFEYTLQKIVLRHLDPYFHGAPKRVTQYYAIEPLMKDCVVLLSILAHTGHSEMEQKENAFRQGIQRLDVENDNQLLSFDECNLAQVDTALQKLEKASPIIKKNVLGACACTIAADGIIQMEEAELLRAIADTLDCPIPPFVED